MTKRATSVEVPADLAWALARSAKARATFDKIPPSHKRRYVQWIGEAKRAETRARRVSQAIKMLAAGKTR